MKKIITGALLLLSVSSCRNMQADYNERAVGVHKTCPHCNFVTSEGRFYAVDTSQQPNIIYNVIFKNGGYWYKASDVDHLIRIN